jgi:hypothetical protein
MDIDPQSETKTLAQKKNVQQNGLGAAKPQEQLNEEDHEKTKFDEGKQPTTKPT